jgi:hypothetical protein
MCEGKSTTPSNTAPYKQRAPFLLSDFPALRLSRWCSLRERHSPPSLIRFPLSRRFPANRGLGQSVIRVETSDDYSSSSAVGMVILREDLGPTLGAEEKKLKMDKRDASELQYYDHRSN